MQSYISAIVSYATLNSQLAKGHEFHYSSVVEPDTLPEGIRKEQFQLSAKGQPVDAASITIRMSLPAIPIGIGQKLDLRKLWLCFKEWNNEM